MADPPDPYQVPDAYKILQVDFEADVDVIQAAYRRLAQKHHPDRVEGPSAATAGEARDRMVAINAAWAILRDPARRTAYDRARAAFLSAKSARADRTNETATDRTTAGTGRPDDGPGRHGSRPGGSATADEGVGRPGSAGGFGPSASGSHGATERTAAWAQRMHDRDAGPTPDRSARGSEAGGAGGGIGDRQPRDARLGHEFRSRTAAPGAGRYGGSGNPFERVADRPFDDGGPGSRRYGRGSEDPAATDVTEPHAGPPPGRPTGSVLNFGRYNGWSLGEIGRMDPGYLEWLDRMPIGRPYRGELDELLRRLGMRQSEAIESAERRGLFRRR